MQITIQYIPDLQTLMIAALAKAGRILQVSSAVRLCAFRFASKGIVVNDPAKSIPSVSARKQRVMSDYQNQRVLALTEEISKLPLKQFAVRVHHLLVDRQKDELFWAAVEQSFASRLKPTTDRTTIRSHAKVLYALSKSKRANGNYETRMGVLLPFASPQSFTSIISSLSRLGPFSQEMGYLVEKIYYQRRNELNCRQKVAVNYSLANNGRQCDTALIECIDQCNAVETITMLRCYDKSELVTPEIMRTALVKLKAVWREFNVLDVSDFIAVFLKHNYLPAEVDELMATSYSLLKKNINDTCLQKIWQFLPDRLNDGKLRVQFVKEVILTTKILRKRKQIGEVEWNRIQPHFNRIDNLELRTDLQKLY